MENKSSSSGLIRTQSDQPVETQSATMKSPRVSFDWGTEMEGSSTKSLTKGGGISASPGGGESTSSRHIRKTRSAQMKFDVDELNSGATLSRASSASMGFSFTAFTVRPSDIADSRPFSDDDDDIRKPTFLPSIKLCQFLSMIFIIRTSLCSIQILVFRTTTQTIIYAYSQTSDMLLQQKILRLVR